MTTRILVVGNGMAGARLAEELHQRDPHAERLEVTVVGEEPHAAYNRILLSNVVAGAISARETRLKPDGWWEARGVDVRLGARVVAVDTEQATATVCRVSPAGAPLTDSAETLPWDELVLATGSRSFVPPVDGLAVPGGAPHELPDGVIAFRTAGECTRIVTAAQRGSRAVVIGGGLLGVEAARGLLMRGVDVTVVHPSGWPMERQLDGDGGAVFARVLRGIGARLVLERRVDRFRQASAERPRAAVLDDGTELACDLLVVAAGVVPRVDLAREIGVDVARGIVVDDQLGTSLPHVHAVGECVEHRGRVYGLVQPGWEQARVLADVLAGTDPDATYTGTDAMTRLKVHDIDLASMGDVTTALHDADHEVVSVADPARGRYAKLVLREDRIVGALMLGGGEVVGTIAQLFDSGAPVPTDRMSLLLGRPAAGSPPGEVNLATMPGSAVLCRCNSVTKHAVVGAWRSGARDVAAVAEATRATTGCGGCTSAVGGICEWLRTVDAAQPGGTAGTGSATTEDPSTANPHRQDPHRQDPPAALTEGAA